MHLQSGLIIAGLCFAAPSWALYNGNPSLPGMPEENLFLKEDSPFSLKIAGLGERVVGQKIHVTSGSSPSYSSFLKGGELSFGFINRVELYTFLGAENLSLNGNKEGKSFSLKTNDSFSGAIGARALAVSWGETQLGFDAKYFYSWPSIDSLSVEGSSKGTNTSTAWQQEWQVGVAVSQRFAFFVPYVGAKYARMQLHFLGLSSDLGGSLAVKNSCPFGVFVGLSLCSKKAVFLDIEASFLDDYAFSGSFGLRF